jgi:hypothetical protein
MTLEQAKARIAAMLDRHPLAGALVVIIPGGFDLLVSMYSAAFVDGATYQREG